MTEKNEETNASSEKLKGLVQKTIGGLEELGGILTGDPNTAAEGEFNVEVGRVREETAEDLEENGNGEE